MCVVGILLMAPSFMDVDKSTLVGHFAMRWSSGDNMRLVVALVVSVYDVRL